MTIEKKLRFAQTSFIVEAIIGAGQSQSNFIDCGGMQPIGLETLSTFTAADLTFDMQTSPSSEISRIVFSPDGVSTVVTLKFGAVQSNMYIPFLPIWAAGLQFMRIKTSAPQTVATRIQVILQPIFQGIHG